MLSGKLPKQSSPKPSGEPSWPLCAVPSGKLPIGRQAPRQGDREPRSQEANHAARENAGAPKPRVTPRARDKCMTRSRQKCMHLCMHPETKVMMQRHQGLVHGYARKLDLAHMINVFHLQSAALNANEATFITNVPTKCNVADFPPKTTSSCSRSRAVDARP